MSLGKLKGMPTIKAVMTPFPHFIGAERSVAEAREMMAEQEFHHLPVMADGEIVGVISERDIERALASGPGGDRLPVSRVARMEAYLVDHSTPLDRVLAHMARHRIGSALVVKEGRLAGIFTTTDACRHFADLLRARFTPPAGDDAA